MLHVAAATSVTRVVHGMFLWLGDVVGGVLQLENQQKLPIQRSQL